MPGAGWAFRGFSNTAFSSDREQTNDQNTMAATGAAGSAKPPTFRIGTSDVQASAMLKSTIKASNLKGNSSTP